MSVVKLWVSEVRVTEERACCDPELWSLETGCTVNTRDALTSSLSRAHSYFVILGRPREIQTLLKFESLLELR